MQLLVYTSNITPRKEYIFNFIFNQILGVAYSLTNDVEAFLKNDGPKISYTKSALADEIYFEETDLLSQTGIVKSELSFAKYEDYEVPFVVASSIFSFDVFAASFYLISRYEEYLNPVKDEHGRFEGKSSLAYKKGFLQKPVIDEWAFALLKILQKRFPELQYKTREFLFTPSLDIDHAYYLKTESSLRKLLKGVKLFLKGNWKNILKDPFDVYQQVSAWDKEFGTKTIYFILMGNKHQLDAIQDKNHKEFKKLIKRISDQHLLGIHPSYLSNENTEELPLEKVQLEQIIGEKVRISRQHYLKLDFPHTYQNLLKNDIREDYTMVYADQPGLRASTCSPFFWYNFEEERMTNLLIHPTAVMDQTLRRYMALTPKESIKELKILIQNVKNVNGTFISLWHNESVSDFGVWKGWKKVYVEMLKMSKL